MSELMGDPFGNYLTQKLLEKCTDSQLEHVIVNIEHAIFRLCKEMHGTRSIQRLIDVATVRQQHHRQLIAKFLKPKIVELSREINGNHVLVKILQSWPHEDKQFIYEILKLKCQLISCHKHGCCLMQKGIDAANSVQKEMLTMTVAGHTRLFVRDPFANYVIQYVLGLKMSHVCREVG